MTRFREVRAVVVIVDGPQEPLQMDSVPRLERGAPCVKDRTRIVGGPRSRRGTHYWEWRFLSSAITVSNFTSLAASKTSK